MSHSAFSRSPLSAQPLECDSSELDKTGGRHFCGGRKGRPLGAQGGGRRGAQSGQWCARVVTSFITGIVWLRLVSTCEQVWWPVQPRAGGDSCLLRTRGRRLPSLGGAVGEGIWEVTLRLVGGGKKEGRSPWSDGSCLYKGPG